MERKERSFASRIKEIERRRIAKLEKKARTLKKKATSLSTQLTNMKTETNELTMKNNELKIMYEEMEHNRQMKDVLCNALEETIEQLKQLITGLDFEQKQAESSLAASSENEDED